MQFVSETIGVSVPVLHCIFADDNVVYLVVNFVAGISMISLIEDEKQLVK